MCGITGWVAFDTDVRKHRATLDAMTATLARRGPDDTGVWLRRDVGLGHRRLAVIDPPGGRQPMTTDTSDGEIAIVYSGETYNLTELRNELVARGHRFRTNSDTEVVLHSYLEWGEYVADHLNGMYAFAIWDGRNNKLVLVRDRLGIKPLYYHVNKDGVIFGSETKAILAHPRVRRIVDENGLRELFAFTRAPRWSLWKDIYEVEPGTVATVTRTGMRMRTYWRLAAAHHEDDHNTTVTRIRDLLTDTVERQLVADVPRCILLSGGLDSSTLTGLAGRGVAAQGERIRTFSVDFAGHEGTFTPDGIRDTPDSPFVRDVVRFVGSAHHDIVLDPADLTDPETRRATLTAREIPASFGDADASLYLLFKAIRAESTVALSGESADEIFGGYRWFHDPAARAAATFPWLLYPTGRFHDETLLRTDVRDLLNVAEYTADQYASATAAVDHLDNSTPLDRRMRTMCHMHLTRFLRLLLDRKDRLAMAVGLEVRVPFCDHRLVEYVYNTPWAFKTYDNREKSLLRQAARHVLPQSVIERVKSPYPSTQDPGYAAELQQQAKDVLADSNTPVFELVDRHWLTNTVDLDPATMPTATRHNLDRVLDLYHWFDLFHPELALAASGNQAQVSTTKEGVRAMTTLVERDNR